METTPKKPNNGLGELHPQEIELIRLIREVYRFGTIEIVIRDGLPIDILKTVVRERLSTPK